jgi:hypothetical protein
MYLIEFEGEFGLNKPLKPEHAQYLQAFQSTRRMCRLTKSDLAAGGMKESTATQPCDDLPDPVRVAVGLPVGPEGAYFVGGGGFAGQNYDESIINYNKPPEGQPGLWCLWEPNEEGTTIRWNGSNIIDLSSSYEYTSWIRYLIDHFLVRWGYILNGEVEWRGDEWTDLGKIEVKNNRVAVKKGRIVYA